MRICWVELDLEEMLRFWSRRLAGRVQNFRTMGLDFQNKMALILGLDFQNWENHGLELVEEKRHEN